MAIYQSWDDIYRIENLRITTESGEGVARNIFSNGLNNVEVIIQFQATNQFGDSITNIPIQDIQEHTGLLTYESGTALLRSITENSPGWVYNTTSNQWTIEPPNSVIQKSQETAEVNPYYDQYQYGTIKQSPNYNFPNYVQTDQPPYYVNDNYNSDQFYYSAPGIHSQLNEDLLSPGLNQPHLQSLGSTNENSLNEDFQQDIRGKWAYSSLNEYSEPYTCASIESFPLDNWSQAPFYVRHGTNIYSYMPISAYINITNPSAQRNYYATNRNSDSGFNSYVAIIAYLAINYSDSRNVVIPPASSVVDTIDSQSLGWTARFLHDGPYYTHYTGVAEYATIGFTPRIGDYFVTSYPITSRAISNATLNDGYVGWSGNAEAGFSAIAFSTSRIVPIAVVSNGGRVNFFYFGPRNYGLDSYIPIDGLIFFQTNSYTYRFAPYFRRSFSLNPGSNPVTLIRVRVVMFEQNVIPYNWHNDAGSPIVLFLQDKYGNSGNFEFSFNNSDHFDVPGATQ